MVRIALVSWLLLAMSLPSYAEDATASWDSNTESDLAGYKVYYGTESGNYEFEMDVGKVVTVTIDSLQANTTYYFAVTAYDEAGNESGFSDEVELFIPPPPDTEPPATPKNVTIVLSSESESQ